jgi:uncharacterized protein (DUF488 family)
VGTIFTIGHSTRTWDELLALLRAHGVRVVVDVRRFPGSRRHPQFSKETLGASLRAAGIDYLHEEALGGRRAVAAGSPNTAWRNRAFRGYADHMATDTFARALARLESTAAARPTAILCAEAVPWRCHRNLIADALAARGAQVLHILSEARAQPHALHPSARVGRDGTLTYPGADAQLLILE